MPATDILALILVIMGAGFCKLGMHGVIDSPTDLEQRFAIGALALGAFCMVIAIWLVG